MINKYWLDEGDYHYYYWSKKFLFFISLLLFIDYYRLISFSFLAYLLFTLDLCEQMLLTTHQYCGYTNSNDNSSKSMWYNLNVVTSEIKLSMTLKPCDSSFEYLFGFWICPYWKSTFKHCLGEMKYWISCPKIYSFA